MRRVLVIGPSVDSKASGGVATHVRNLKNLDSFKSATFYNPGGVDKSHGGFRSLVGFLKLPILFLKHDLIIVNSSLHTFSMVKLALMMLLNVIGSRRFLVFFHGGRYADLARFSAMLFRVVAFLSASKVEKFYFLSKTQSEQMRLILPASKCDNYGNYSADQHFVQSDTNSEILTFLFVGRIVEAKGVFDLLDAFIGLNKKVSAKVKLCYAGDGPDLDALKSRSVGFDNISFLGHVSGAALDSAYRSASVVCLPSRHPEGFPYVLIESMRYGKPLLASTQGVLPDYVQNGVNGYIIESTSADHILEGMVAILDILEKDPIAIESYCHHVFEESFSANKAEQFYGSLLE